MRLNRFIATYSDTSRRKADVLIEQGEVIVNRKVAHIGMEVKDTDRIIVSGIRLVPVKRQTMTVTLNKPKGYICSRDGQGSPRVYDLLQGRMQHLKIAGRLDKDSSGLVVLTNDGQLLQELTHPTHNKEKIYTVSLSRPLDDKTLQAIKSGVDISDTRLSRLRIKHLTDANYTVTLTEGRNRQIRRTFEALGYHVTRLHRTVLGPYDLGRLKPGEFLEQ